MPTSRRVTSVSSREFNQDTGRAKRAARRGPVVITDRGRPSHVLLTLEEYNRLAASTSSTSSANGRDYPFEVALPADASPASS